MRDAYAVIAGIVAYGLAGCAGVADRAVLPDATPAGEVAPVNVDTVPRAVASRTVALKKVDTPPRQLRAVTPAYTATMTERRVEGRVTARMLIDERGRVIAVRVLRDIGYDSAEATRTALKKYTFEPARKDGRPVPVWIPISVTFTLHR